MAHLHIIGYMPPDKHEQFMSEVNNWEYKAEGKHRVGTISPFVSEIKAYDIRIPEELIPEFLRDISAQEIDGVIDRLNQLHSHPVLKMILKLYKKFNFYKKVTKATGPKQYNLGIGWSNFYCIGKLDDDFGINKLTGEKREIL